MRIPRVAAGALAVLFLAGCSSTTTTTFTAPNACVAAVKAMGAPTKAASEASSTFSDTLTKLATAPAAAFGPVGETAAAVSVAQANLADAYLDLASVTKGAYSDAVSEAETTLVNGSSSMQAFADAAKAYASESGAGETTAALNSTAAGALTSTKAVSKAINKVTAMTDPSESNFSYELVCR